MILFSLLFIIFLQIGRRSWRKSCSSSWKKICLYKVNQIYTSVHQRWKNVQACKQCLCKFFQSLGLWQILLCFVAKVSYVAILRFLVSYLWLLMKYILNFTLKRGQKSMYDINVASIVVWWSYFAHSCCPIHLCCFVANSLLF